MKLMSHITGAGAKGKFSGGFDISAFGGLQGGQQGMLIFFPCKVILVYAFAYI